MADARPTIFALSSGRPPAAIAVVRVSGPRAGAALEKLIGRVPEPRQATLARVRDPATGDVIDEALVLWFPAPRSETGEDTAELQLHGGHAVVAGVLEALGRIEGCRPAEAGRVHPPGLRERPARSHGGGGPGRSDRGRDARRNGGRRSASSRA